MPFETLSQALEMDRESSPWRLSLNGSWKFHWAENPKQAPGKFYIPGYDTRDWKNIRVPSNWHHFRDLNELDASWTLTEDGIELQSG